MMWHDIISLLHSTRYNWSWFAVLVAAMVAAGISVFVSHVQQYRQHSGSRLTSDLFVREQLAFFSYGPALYASAYRQPDQNFLVPWIGLLTVMGIALYLFGMWLTTGRRITEILRRDQHFCPANPEDPCPEKLPRRAKWLLIWFPFLLVLVSFLLALFLTFALTEASTTKAMTTAGNLVPTNLEIASIRAGSTAFTNTPAFLRDNLDRLENEQRNAKTPDHIVGIVESETLQDYGRFCWTVTLARDYQPAFTLSTRAAYLLHPDGSFRELEEGGIGQPYTTIFARVPQSFAGDKIVITASVYARSPGQKVLHDVSRMLQTGVNCP
jgi:hypothetical protein